MQITDSPTSTAMRGVRVVPRLPDLVFADADVPRLWHSGSVGITAFWDALTIAGPPIESFFLRDARKFAPLVKSNGLAPAFEPEQPDAGRVREENVAKEPRASRFLGVRGPESPVSSV